MFSYKDITSVQLYGQIFIQIEIGSQRNVAFPSAHDAGSAIVQVRIIETCREFYRLFTARPAGNTVQVVIRKPSSPNQKACLHISSLRTVSLPFRTIETVQKVFSLYHETRSGIKYLKNAFEFCP